MINHEIHEIHEKNLYLMSFVSFVSFVVHRVFPNEENLFFVNVNLRFFPPLWL